MKISKKKYLTSFLTVIIVLALVRCAFPAVAERRGGAISSPGPTDAATNDISKETLSGELPKASSPATSSSAVQLPAPDSLRSRFFDSEGRTVKHRIYSVPGYSKTFPDSQNVQLASAQQWGVGAVESREMAEQMKDQLVYIASNPYYRVDPLTSSIPYLVPRAALLLQDIGRNFFDSLQIKGVPLHQPIVTSVLRTRHDVGRLQTRNGNATSNSCHLYGTTFDICYNRYHTVSPPGEQRRSVRNDSLKYILAEVLRDMREQGRCHVKYEVKQGCFHITVR